MTTDTTKRIPYRPFGIFRLALSLLVILQHIHTLAPGRFDMPLTGTSAVMAFFVLSGFILTEAAHRTYHSRPVAFMTNRVLRIVPLYWLGMLFSVLIHVAVHSRIPNMLEDPLFARSFADMFRVSNILANLLAFVIPSHTGYIFVPYIWAVRVEFTFYTFVFMVLLIGQFISARITLATAIVVAAGLFVFFLVRGAPEQFSFVPFFALGAIMYVAVRYRDLRASAIALILFVISLWTAGRFVLPNASPDGLSLPVVLGHVAGLALLIGTIPVLAMGNVRDGMRKVDRVGGALSYPIYIQQYGIIVAAHGFASRSYTTMIGAIVAIGVVSFLSEALTDRFVATLRDRVRGRKLEDVAPIAGLDTAR